MSGEARITLRPACADDVPTFFTHQREPAACAMAIWESRDWPACSANWQRVLNDSTNTTRTIIFDGAVAGYVAAFNRENRREVCYWIGSEFWGHGVATAALGALLAIEPARPLLARVVGSNKASIRVLEKHGFRTGGRHAADDGVEEIWLILER